MMFVRTSVFAILALFVVASVANPQVSGQQDARYRNGGGRCPCEPRRPRCFCRPRPPPPPAPNMNNVGASSSSAPAPSPSSSTSATSGGNCECPIDKNGDHGVRINTFTTHQCAYPGGACTWNDKNGELQNSGQTHCPANDPCEGGSCTCPVDKNGDSGTLINRDSFYQCAYAGGACLWDSNGSVQNGSQSNCPNSANKCSL